MVLKNGVIEIGLIGCGRWGSNILRDLRSCGAEVHVVAKNNLSLAKAGGAASTHQDIAQLAAMDGYVVATPTITHAAVIEGLLATGRPIFVEKPMTADVASARRIAKEAAGRLFVMDKWRYHPGIDAMRREIAGGRTGKVVAINLVRWSWGQPHSDVSPLWILAPHDLSILLHLTGSIPPLKSAVEWATQSPGLGFTALMGAEDGPFVTLSVSIASPEHRRRCLVVGEKATLELRESHDTTVFVRDGAPGSAAAIANTIETSNEMPLLAEIKSFLHFVAGGPPPMSSAAEGLAVVERLSEIETALLSGAHR